MSKQVYKKGLIMKKSFFDHKDRNCIGYVNDDGNVHFAILIDSKVIAFEHIPETYPSTMIFFYDSVSEWRAEIEGREWIEEGLRKGCMGFPGADELDPTPEELEDEQRRTCSHPI